VGKTLMATPELINSNDSRIPFVEVVDPQAIFLFDQIHNGQRKTVKTSAEKLLENTDGGGGHTIDVNGLSLPQRAVLSFFGPFTAEDDQPNDTTRIKLENVAGKYAIAWGNLTQEIPNNIPTVVDFGTKFHARGSTDGASQIVEEVGIYFLGACVRFPVAAGSLTLKIQVDTQDIGIEQSLPGAQTPVTLNCSGEVNLNPSSEWRVIVLQTSGALLTIEVLRIWGSWRSGDANAQLPN
jgi:hypothetical protein